MDLKLFENLDKAIKKFDDMSISGWDLSDPDPRIIVFDQIDINTQVIMQAPAIAYYGYQLDRAEAELRACKEDFDKWMKIKKLEAEAQLLGSNPDKEYKPSEAKKEARVYINCKEKAKADGKEMDEATEWIEKIRLLEEARDKIKFFFNGFTTKNFLINTYANKMNIEDCAVETIKEKTPIERPLSNMTGGKFRHEFKR